MIEIKIKVVGDPRAAWLSRRRKLPIALMRAATAAARGLSAYTHERYLNFEAKGPPQPHGLRHQTGRLGRATNATALGRPQDIGGTRFKSQWGVLDPNVPYAYKHEFGGEYTEEIGDFWRRSPGTAGRGAKTVRAREGMGAGLIRVRGGVRTRTYQPRRMFRTAAAEKGRQVVELAAEAVLGPLTRDDRLIDGQSIRAALGAAGVPGRDPR